METSKSTEICLSVAMLTFKHEKYIRQAIDGVLMQDFDRPMELIISDDSDSVVIKGIIEEYISTHPKGKIIKLYSHSKNLGMVDNFIFTLKKCRGKYVAYCEGDDYWTDPKKIQKQVDLLEASPDVVVSCHNAMKVSDDNRIIAESVLPAAEQRNYSSAELQKGAWLLTPTLCFRNVIRDFPSEFHGIPNPDSFFTSLLGKFGTCHFQGGILPSAYRVHEGGVFSMIDESKRKFNRGKTFLHILKYYHRVKNKELKEHFLDLYFKNQKTLYSDLSGNNRQHEAAGLKKATLKNILRYGSIRVYLSCRKNF